MNRNPFKWAGAIVLASTLLSFTSCSTTSGTEEVDTIDTDNGVITVDTYTTTATVTAKDTANRKVTLVAPNGHKTTYKCGPEVVNFDQIEMGDQVKATVTQEAAIYIGHGAPPSQVEGVGVALAPVGAKPGGMMVDTVRGTAEVTAVNAKKREVTLTLGDGIAKTVKVGKKVDLSAVRVGDNVTVQLSNGLALSVEKP